MSRHTRTPMRHDISPLQRSNAATLQRSTAPPLHRSTAPTLHRSNAPTLHRSTAPTGANQGKSTQIKVKNPTTLLRGLIQGVIDEKIEVRQTGRRPKTK